VPSDADAVVAQAAADKVSECGHIFGVLLEDIPPFSL